MRYGKFLKDNGSIGIVCPSFGCSGYPYEEKTNNAIKKFKKNGYKLYFSHKAFEVNFDNLLDDDYKNKGDQFNKLYEDKNIDILISMSGGELMCNTIDYIDFNKIKKSKPKWFMGYSDNTWLTFLLPTLCDTASIYSYNFSAFGSNSYHQSIKDSLEILKGNIVDQNSFDKYQNINKSKEPGLALTKFNLDTKTSWKELNNKDNITFKGRIIGGCLDVLDYIIGTKYDNVDNFTKKYHKDGFIWYFENCELNILDQLRTYKHIINANWIKNCKGILIGRTAQKDTIFGVNYVNMLHDCFDYLNIPVLYDVDIGHLEPMVSIINGSIAEISYSNKKGTIKQYLI